MKTIDTLVEDIETLIETKPGVPLSLIERLGERIADTLDRRLNGPDRIPRLSASNVGTPCKRKLWYSVNQPEKEEKLPANVLLNFLYGDIIEEFYLFLAEAAGHKVEGRQDTIEVEGVPGDRDAVIDGVLTDVKSANGRSFKKFKFNQVKSDDPFGYIKQLTHYHEGSKDDPLVTDKHRMAFFAVNKERGGCVVDLYDRDKFDDHAAFVRERKAMVESPTPPPQGFIPIPDGKSGNMKLDVACSYCSFRKECWPEARTFLYSNGPRHLTRVVRKPDVPEVTS